MRKVVSVLVFVFLGLQSRTALSDKPLAQEHSSRAQALLTAGDYARAVDEFALAYRAYASPQFLYNMAQIQRKNLDQCSAALRSYQQFLAAGPFEATALQRAAALARKHKRLLTLRCPPSAPNRPPAKANENSTSIVDSQPKQEPPAIKAEPQTNPINSNLYDDEMQPLQPVIRIDGGGNQYLLGEVDIPITGSIRVGLGWPLGIDELPLRAVVSAAFSPMRYRGTETGVANFVPVLVGLEFATASNGIALDASLSIGALGILGIADGNPLTADGMAMGASWTPTAKGRVGVAMPLSDTWALSGGVEAGTASSPEGFAADIKSIFMFGLSAGISRNL